MDRIFQEIKQEYQIAANKYPKFHSTHEGYAVLKEELDELWTEIKANKNLSGNGSMRKEAIQIATMAIRFIKDLCN